MNIFDAEEKFCNLLQLTVQGVVDEILPLPPPLHHPWSMALRTPESTYASSGQD
jgi:hypothetical protein